MRSTERCTRRIYTDGNRFTVTIAGTRIEDNDANEGGGAVFFVSNDIFFLGASRPTMVRSVLR